MLQYETHCSVVRLNESNFPLKQKKRSSSLATYLEHVSVTEHVLLYVVSVQADPEDGVSYASISYTRVANSKAEVSCLIGYTRVGRE